jgi:hypothetical protein
MTIKNNSCYVDYLPGYSFSNVLIQLIEYGSQDFYLKGNPKISYFKCKYVQNTNFATESIEQPFGGTYNNDYVPDNNYMEDDIIVGNNIGFNNRYNNVNNTMRMISNTTWNYGDIFGYLKGYISKMF